MRLQHYPYTLGPGESVDVYGVGAYVRLQDTTGEVLVELPETNSGGLMQGGQGFPAAGQFSHVRITNPSSTETRRGKLVVAPRGYDSDRIEGEVTQDTILSQRYPIYSSYRGLTATNYGALVFRNPAASGKACYVHEVWVDTVSAKEYRLLRQPISGATLAAVAGLASAADNEHAGAGTASVLTGGTWDDATPYYATYSHADALYLRQTYGETTPTRYKPIRPQIIWPGEELAVMLVATAGVMSGNLIWEERPI